MNANALQNFEVDEITTFLKEKSQIQVCFSFCDKALFQSTFSSSFSDRASASPFWLFVGLTQELSLFCFSAFPSLTTYALQIIYFLLLNLILV